MNILVSGSLAYDRIMDFPGNFADHIVMEKSHMINLSFAVNGMVEKFGGTAGNIAYALSLLGEKPLILATIGQDYGRYFEWLDRYDIPTRGIRIISEEFTAGAFITTDQADNQITGFNPGAMKHPSAFDLSRAGSETTFALVSPGNPDDMMDYPQAYRDRGIPFIFDPGQQIPMLDAEQMMHGIRGAKALVANDYEMELITRKVGLDVKGLLDHTEAVITTKGEEGAVVATRDGDVSVAAVPPSQVVDPTGAGDAFRAGLTKGLIDGRDWTTAVQMGACCAAYAVETYGTQEYSYTVEAYWERFERQFGKVTA